MALSLVVHAVGAQSGASSVTPGVDTTGVTLLIVPVAHFGEPATVSDSKGNTWNGLTTYGSSGTRVKIYWCRPTSVGPGHTFSGGPGYPAIAMIGFSGESTSPFEAESGSLTTQPGSITPSGDNELLVSAICYYPGNTPTIDSGFSISDTGDYNSGISMGVSLAYQIQGASTTRNPTWSPSTSFGEIQSTLAAFRAAAGATSTILAATGSTVSVTPGSAAFLRSSTLAATGGSVAVTTGTAALLRSTTLAAPGGSVTITPGTVALLRSTTLDATGSTVTITPGSAELLRSLVLPATGSTVTITPGTAGLFKTAPGSTTLDAPGSSVTITPGTAVLLRSMVLAATGGTVTITPGEAALIAPFASTILAAPGGTVAITPGAAVLLRSRVLSAPGSAVAITPGTAGLFKTIPGATILAAPGGTITVTPGMAVLKLRSASADVVTVFASTAVRRGVDSVASIGGRRWGVDPTSSTGVGR